MEMKTLLAGEEVVAYMSARVLNHVKNVGFIYYFFKFFQVNAPEGLHVFTCVDMDVEEMAANKRTWLRNEL